MRSSWARCLAIALVACGRLDFDVRGDAPDPEPDAFPQGPFGPATLVAAFSDPANEDDPTLTADLLEIYFSSTRISGMDGNSDVFRSTRATTSDPWGAPSPIVELNTGTNDENPGIAPDGLTLWFSSNRMGDLDIYVTTRADRGDPWNPPTRVAELSASGDDLGAEPVRSLLRLTMYRDTPRSLYETTRPSPASPWSPPAALTAVNSANDDLSGFFVTELELWFASNRPGGIGAHDLYRVTRPSTDEPFGAPTRIEGVNSSARDDDPWLSPDGRTLYFVSRRTGDEEIYVAERSD